MGKSKWVLRISIPLWSVLCLLVPMQISSSPSAPCRLADIDRDDDGLIEICDLEALNAIRYQLDGSGYRASATAAKITAGCSVGEGCKGYELIKDLDFNDDASYRRPQNKDLWLGADGWQPIGDAFNSFSAIFKGNNHTISNLRIRRSIDNAGLFARIQEAAEIDGVTLSDIDIRGDFGVGALVAYNEGEISDSGVSGGTLVSEGDIGGGLVGVNRGVIVNSDMHADVRGVGKVGGLVGENKGSIMNSCAGGDITATQSYIGGLVGYNDGLIINGCAHANISVAAPVVGGLVGYNGGSLANSYAASRVASTLGTVGGLVGRNEGSITDSYAMGRGDGMYDVQGSHGVGGLVGCNRNAIVNAYATARVRESNYTGGLIGFDCIGGSVNHSYWDLTASGISRSGDGTFATAAQLQSPTAPGDDPRQVYYGWSTRSWDFGSARHYPLLKYIESADATSPRAACADTARDGIALPKCGDLLVGQYTRLSDLILADGLVLTPTFDTDVFEYRVEVGDDTEDLRLFATAVDSDAPISVGVGEGDRFVESNTWSVVPLDAAADATLITVARQYKINALYPLKIKGVPHDRRVNEGDILRLEVSDTRGLYGRPQQYRWTQLSGMPLWRGIDTHHSFLEIKVPEDWVAGDADGGDVVLQVQVGDDATTDSAQTTLTIVKTENGSSPIRPPAPRFIGETFTLVGPEINATHLSADPDGIGALEIFAYRWQSRSPSAAASWRDIEGATAARYDIPLSLNLSDRTRYRVSANYRDGQGYTNNRVVSAEFGLAITDVDTDDDGLIEIRYLEDFAAMRYQPDGSGYRESFNTPQKITQGCPAGRCLGYELVRDLDFNSDDSYRDISNKSKWAGDGLWQYIGGAGGGNPFTAIFDGNNNTISNFKIHRDDISRVSLFGHTRGKIMNLGLLNVDVVGREFVAALAAHNEGIIANCYATGRVVSTGVGTDYFGAGSLTGGLVGIHANFGNDAKALIINSFAAVNVEANGRYVGGLVGSNAATIVNSYASGRVAADSSSIGGLVGYNDRNAAILNSYARGIVAGRENLGGLVGYSNGKITDSFAAVAIAAGDAVGGLVGTALADAQVINSYWDSQAGAIPYSMGGTSKTTAELRAATAAESTTPADAYYKWSNEAWDFGTREQYPTLKYIPIPTSVLASDSAQSYATCATATSGDSALPTCGTLLADRQNGLDELVLLAQSDISISPAFARSVTDYEVIIAGDDRRLRLIATATDRNAVIGIAVNERTIDENIKSGTTASVILLDGDNTNRITVEVRGKAVDYYTLNTIYIPFKDVDEDDDGLIEIRKLEDLNAMRYDLHGRAYKAGADATAMTLGCPESGCKGYELTSDLDFNDDAHYRDIANKYFWTVGEGWQPIGSSAQPFRAIFRGNLKAIHNLTINRPEVDDVALFAVLGEGAEIDGVGLLNTDILGKRRVGSLAAANLRGTISHSYADGDVKSVGDTRGSVGGLAGMNGGVLSNSYVIGHITAQGASVAVGGLVGWNLRLNPSSNLAVHEQSGVILNSYAVSKVEGGIYTGGLVGRNSTAAIVHSYAIADVPADNRHTRALVGENVGGSISTSYWDTTVAAADDTDFVHSTVTGVIGLTSAALKAPTAAGSTSTQTYFNWSERDWDFGTSEQYPVLKYNHPRCKDPIVPPCNTVFSSQKDNRLRSLIVSGGVDLVPVFEPLIFTYDLYLSAEMDYIRLTPTAYDSTYITIYNDGDLIESIASGATSSPILSGKESTINVKVVVEDGATFQYTIRVHRLDTIIRDIDEDGDGLIEVSNLEELNEIRYQPDGSGYRESATAAKISIGCPAGGCKGYELDRHLDFEDATSYRNVYYQDLGNRYRWNYRRAWQPIRGFNGIFKANGHTISNLKIDKRNADRVGLFADTGSGAVIEGVGLLNTDVVGRNNVGALVGSNRGVISDSYAIGSSTGHGGDSDDVGGLVGSNVGTINNSYAMGNVLGSRSVGGLVGRNSGSVNNVYTAGNVSANRAGGGLVGSNEHVVMNAYTIADVSAGRNGGLVGDNSGRIANSYWNVDTSREKQSAAGTSATTAQLQSPTAPALSAHQVYFNWSTENWDFGDESQYPILKQVDDGCKAARRSAACGTLLANQRFGLLSLERSAGVRLFPPFRSGIFNYDITLDADRSTFSVTPTAINHDDEILLSVDAGSDLRIGGGERSRPIAAHSGRFTIEVQSQSGKRVSYTFRMHRLSFIVDDIDKDDDGLIEINYLEDLHAIRYGLDGRGYRENEAAPLLTEGCPQQGCNGYELARDLDFNDDASYRRPTPNKRAWTEGDGWLPIGDEHRFFSGLFKGNGKTLSGLTINRAAADGVALFARVDGGGRIEGLGVLNLRLTANDNAGALVGVSNGTIANSFASGRIIGRGSNIGGLVGAQGSASAMVNSYARVSVTGTDAVGGLVGLNRGRIGSCYAIADIASTGYGSGGLVGLNAAGWVKNNYAVGDVAGRGDVGGFIGRNESNGIVADNYAVGRVTGRGDVGGFIAVNAVDSTLSDNYWNIRTSGITTGVGGSTGFSGALLKAATTPSAAIYTGWRSKVWDFGTSAQYPSLKYVTAADVADSFAEDPACAMSAEPRCGTLIGGQKLGLVGIASAAKAFNLYPRFARAVLAYSMTVFSDTEHLRLIAVAYDADAHIRIRNGQSFDQIVASATTSSAIPLNSSGTTVIAIDVQPPGDASLRYTIAVNRLAFAMSEHKVDRDGDGLIDINYLEDLHAMHYQSDGSGYRLSSTASKITAGCPATGCYGYELIRDLDFKDDDSYRDAATNKRRGLLGSGWQPIGSRDAPFVAVFDGNRKTVAHLNIRRHRADDVGLFGVVAAEGRIMNVGLSAASIVGGDTVGGLVGTLGGAISNSRVLAEVRGGDDVGGLVGETLAAAAIVNSYANADVVGRHRVGGFVGFNRGRIGACYALGDVVADGEHIGGFVGRNFGASITDNYAIGDVAGAAKVGGFIGSHHRSGGIVSNNYALGRVTGRGANVGGFGAVNNGGTFVANYWNIETSGETASVAGSLGFTTEALQSPTLPTATVYAGWSNDVWHFGTPAQYPSLKYIDGTDVADLFKRDPACGASHSLPQCNTVLSHQHTALADLSLLPEGFNLMPSFASYIYDYRATVFADTEAIRLVATAYDNDAIIRIRHGDINELAASAATSTAIPLHTSPTTVITITVQRQNRSSLSYTIALTRLDFRTDDKRVDKDGDGLIEINYLEDLHAMRYQLDGSGYRANSAASKITAGCPTLGCNGYELIRDLDFKEDDSYRNAAAHRDAWTSNRGWLPVGSEPYPFVAIFNADNKTVANLHIDRPDTNAVGLFAAVGDDAKIKGVGLSAVEIIGNNKVGALVGIGNGVIVNSNADGRIRGQHSVGGLVGENNAVIVNSYAYSDLSGAYYIGGLVGFNTGTLSSCYAVGDVNGEEYDIGGFVGVNFGGKVRNNYAVGTVRGEHDVGGFIGSNESRGEVTHNYAVAEVIGNGRNIGGFAGANTGITFSANYWDKEVGKIEETISGNIGLDGSDMKSLPTQSVYSDWDTTAWHFEVGVYPHLKRVKGVAVANLPAADTACDAMSDFICGRLISGQRIGLANLEIAAPELTLLPRFNNWILDYRTTVYANTQSIRLVATAYLKNSLYNKNSTIRISRGQDFNELAASAVASPAIPLHTSGTTTIHIDVRTEDDKTRRYSVEVVRLELLTAGEKVDRDGDGLIEIDYLEDLHAIRYQLDGSGYRVSTDTAKISAGCPHNRCVGYELSRSLDFKENTSYRNAIIPTKLWTEGVGWLPIGSEQNPFVGVFEGRGYTISNLIINRPQSDGVALFAHTASEARISDIGLSAIAVLGGRRVGGLVAVHAGTIEKSRVKGSISGRHEVGGLVGRNYGIVRASHASGRVVAQSSRRNSERAGGLVGYNANQIINSFAINDIVGHRIVGGLAGSNGGDRPAVGIFNSYAINAVKGDSVVGGLVGLNDSEAKIINSYADGEVSADKHTVGGLVGLNYDVIDNTYATGRVSGSRLVGGLVGSNRGLVNDSYASTVVVGRDAVGGLVGVGQGNLVVHSYWDSDVGNTARSAGGIGFSTAALQTPVVAGNAADAPYYRWHSEDWYFGNAYQYPTLRYASGDMDNAAACGDASALPTCEARLLPYGLAKLEIIEPARWSRPFGFSRFNYGVTVNRHTRRIRLLPTAYASDAVITVTANNEAAIVDSGTLSSPIALHHSDATVVTVEISDIVYRLTVNYPPTLDRIKDIDDDDDGLIEINYLEDLHAIRYQPDGTAYRADSEAKRTTLGCAVGGCRGYELVGDLDFSSDRSYRDARRNKALWTTQRGWLPIGGLGGVAFDGLLQGNGYSIYNLRIARRGSDAVGLFGVVTDDAEIDGVGLLNCDVEGAFMVGGLVGWNKGAKIANSYVGGRVTAKERIGGLVGRNDGVVSNSYATGRVLSRDSYVGGLVGENRSRITNGYATAHVTGSRYGGALVGLNSGSVANSYAAGGVRLTRSALTGGLAGATTGGEIIYSYWDTETSGIERGMHGRGVASEALKSPVAVGTTLSDVYYGWHRDDWDFGTSEHYPALKYTNDPNTLLPHQRAGLRRLALSDRVELFPVFNTHVFDYHVVVPGDVHSIGMAASALDDNAEIRVDSVHLTSRQSTPLLATVPIRQTSTTRIVISVQAQRGTAVSYRLLVHRSSPIAIDGIPGRAVGEGQRVGLRADHRLGRTSLRYKWTQISGPPLLSAVETERAVLSFTVPTDAVARRAASAAAVLRLEIHDGDMRLSRDVSVTIDKRDNGALRQRIEAPALKNTALTVYADLASDPDGAGDLQSVVYQWQSLAPTFDARWRDIAAAIEQTYTIPSSVVDATRYRVLIAYADKQGYIHRNIASQAYTAIDIDKDDDGLIEIDDIAGLDAIRRVPDGRSYKADPRATTSTVGCPLSGCRGYELVENLDLNGIHRQAIGTAQAPFSGIFKGNNFMISNLRIDSDDDAVGLFGVVASTARIEGVGLIRAAITGRNDVGTLAGINEGIIGSSYAVESSVVGVGGGVGGLVGSNRGGDDLAATVVHSYAHASVRLKAGGDAIAKAGGLVGENINGAAIINSYAKGSAVGACYVGGLVGYNGGETSRIVNNYAHGSVTRFGRVAYCDTNNIKFAGGLVGYNDKAIVQNGYAVGPVVGDVGDRVGGLIGGAYDNTDVQHSHWDITTSGVETSAGGTSKTTVQLQSPITAGSISTEPYFGWHRDDWDFGNSAQYPLLKYGSANRVCGFSKSYGCNLLLPDQSRSSGLTQLILARDASLVPTFNPKTFSYKVATRAERVEFVLVLENLNAESRIEKNGVLTKVAMTGELISIPIDETTPILITIDIAEQDQRPQRYELHINRAPEAIISADFKDTVDEGMRVRVDGTGSRDLDETDRLHYRWEQISGPPLSLDAAAKSAAVLAFRIAEDFVAKADTNTRVVLSLTVNDGTVSAKERIAIAVKKINNGNISVAAPQFIDAYAMAAAIDLSKDVDGVGSDADVEYQWQVKEATGWRDIADATNKIYRLRPHTAANTLYRVRLSYTDGQAYIATTMSAALMFNLDVDKDDDGLIELSSLEGLDAMRYALNGEGYRENINADVVATGCPMSKCRGYELVVDLDFKDDASYRNPTVNKNRWLQGEGWQPIGDINDSFNAVFDGNGYTISNLTIKNDGRDAGLFGDVGAAAEINNIGLLYATVRGDRNVGAIAGAVDRATINNSYAIAAIQGVAAAGGLVGFRIGGVINNCYAGGYVAGDRAAGGLVGIDLGGVVNNSYTRNIIEGTIYGGGLIGFSSNATINDSYTRGRVQSHNNTGGLMGIAVKVEQVAYSYWNADNIAASKDSYGIALTTAQLQKPVAAGTTSTDTYYGWHSDDWDFGDELQYPILKDSDGALLPYQRVGLRHLSLSDSAILSPNFAAEIFTYDVSVAADATQLRVLPVAHNDAADIRVNGYKTLSATLSSPIALHEATATVITVDVRAADILPIRYTLNVNNDLPQVAIDRRSQGIISEGDYVALDVTTSDANGDTLKYRWSQNFGADMLSAIRIRSGVIANQNDADLFFKVPENLLTATQDSSEVELCLTVGDGNTSIDKKVLLSIVKKNNGVISKPAPPTLSDLSYVAPVVTPLLVHEPDGAAHPNTVRYQWQKYERARWVDIKDEIGSGYTPHAAEIDQPYRVFIGYTDYQGHQDSVASEQTVYTVSESSLMDFFIDVRVFLEGLLAE